MKRKENLSLRYWKALKGLKDYEKDNKRYGLAGLAIYSYLKDGPFAKVEKRCSFGMWKRYLLSTEGTRKESLFCQKMVKGYNFYFLVSRSTNLRNTTKQQWFYVPKRAFNYENS